MGNQPGVARVAQLSGIRATAARHVFGPPRVVGMDDQNPNRTAALPRHRDVSDEVFTWRQRTVVVRSATVIDTCNRFGVAARLPLPVRS
jgi:hypothetical protein